MGNFIAGVSTATDITLWPMVVAQDLGSNRMTRAAVGMAVGGTAAYFAMGNPLDLVRQQDLVSLGITYGIVGVGYVVGENIFDKINQQQRN